LLYEQCGEEGVLTGERRVRVAGVLEITKLASAIPLLPLVSFLVGRHAVHVHHVQHTLFRNDNRDFFVVRHCRIRKLLRVRRLGGVLRAAACLICLCKGQEGVGRWSARLSADWSSNQLAECGGQDSSSPEKLAVWYVSSALVNCIVIISAHI